MTTILLTGPTIKPISLEETKTFLRVEHEDENQLIAALIAGARNHIEAQRQTALITQDCAWFGATAPLPGEMGQWAMIVLTAYFGGRSIEKVARILNRK